MSVVTLNEGSIFADRYKVVRCIASGGMGAVYEVVHLETDSHRALKVMLPHLMGSDDLRERFRREARVAAQIKSAYIVDVSDAGVDEATKMPFLVMELLQGEELGKRLRRVGRFGFEETVAHLWQAALALDKTHRANIVHRDLKPENLFLCEDDDGPSQIKVLDFGIAKIVAEGGTAANATRAMGTPLYMAPEQFKSKSKVSPATDIYSLGMMAYTLLVGVSYWADEQATEDNAFAFAGVVMHGPPEAPTVRALRKGVKLPKAFDDWFRQATSPNPEQRFFKAKPAITGLAQALGVPVPTTSAGYAGSSTNPPGMGAVPGQTSPGQTDAGQTGSVQTGAGQPHSAASSSGPQGTVMLESTPPPADQGTHASGYGLSSSQPRVTSAPSLPRMDTPHTGAPVDAPKRGKTLPMIAVAGVVLVAVVMGVVALGRKNKEPVANVATVVPLPVPSATMPTPEVPKVEPVETVKVVESAAAPEPVPPTVETATSAAPTAEHAKPTAPTAGTVKLTAPATDTAKPTAGTATSAAEVKPPAAPQTATGAAKTPVPPASNPGTTRDPWERK